MFGQQRIGHMENMLILQHGKTRKKAILCLILIGIAYKNAMKAVGTRDMTFVHYFGAFGHKVTPLIGTCLS